MLLAQFYVSGPAPRPHNVEENANGNYAVRQLTHICGACGDLKNHILEHGHLGYFPMFSVINENPYVKAHKLVPRGIFRVHSDISRRIMNAQRYALNWCNTFSLDGDGWEFFNRLPNYLSNLGFCIDPITPFPDGLAQNIVNALGTIVPRQDPGTLDLTGWTNNLINWLFSTNRIQNVEIQNVENNRFSLDVTYNNDRNSIGLKRDGRSTNTVKIVVQVQNGIINIVTMYPI